MNRKVRFRTGKMWSRWYNANEDLKEVLIGYEIEAIHVQEEMTVQDFKKLHPDLAEKLK